MKIRHWFFFSSIFVLFGPGLFPCSFAQTVRIAASEYAPYNYMENGQVTGISAEVVRRVLEETGITLPIKLYPWPRAYKMALSGPTTLIFPVSRISERENLLKWVGTISPQDTYLYGLAAREDIVLNRLEDARVYRIGCVREDFTLSYLQSRSIPVEIVNFKEELNIRMLLAKRLDLIPFTEPAFVHRIQTLGISPSRFDKKYHLKEISSDFYMAFSKDTPDALVERFGRGLRAIKASGEYQKIVDSFLKH